MKKKIILLLAVATATILLALFGQAENGFLGRTYYYSLHGWICIIGLFVITAVLLLVASWSVKRRKK